MHCIALMIEKRPAPRGTVIVKQILQYLLIKYLFNLAHTLKI